MKIITNMNETFLSARAESSGRQPAWLKMQKEQTNVRTSRPGIKVEEVKSKVLTSVYFTGAGMILAVLIAGFFIFRKYKQ